MRKPSCCGKAYTTTCRRTGGVTMAAGGAATPGRNTAVEANRSNDNADDMARRFTVQSLLSSRAAQVTVRQRQATGLGLAVVRDHDGRGVASVVGNHFAPG